MEGFACKYYCDHLVYYESFDNILKAISQEKQLKGWRRSKKIALIERVNPRWQDFAEHTGAQTAFVGESMIGKNSFLPPAAPTVQGCFDSGVRPRST